MRKPFSCRAVRPSSASLCTWGVPKDYGRCQSVRLADVGASGVEILEPARQSQIQFLLARDGQPSLPGPLQKALVERAVCFSGAVVPHGPLLEESYLVALGESLQARSVHLSLIHI